MGVNEATAEIKVVGMDGLVKSLRHADKDIQKSFRAALKESAKPITTLASALSTSDISHNRPGGPWSKFRIGMLAGGRVVYMAPKPHGISSRQSRAQRRGRYSRMSGRQLAGAARPRFAPILLERAMEPALEASQEEVKKAVQVAVDMVIAEIRGA